MKLEDLKKLSALRTKGEWISHGSFHKDQLCIKPEWFDEIVDERELREADQLVHGDDGYYFDRAEDAELICAAVNNLDALIAVAEAAKKAIMDTPHKPECASNKLGLHCICWQAGVNRALNKLEGRDGDESRILRPAVSARDL